MTDTPLEVESRYHALLMALPAERRLRMASSMSATARTLVLASALTRDPGASEAELRRTLFLRFYGDDFTPRDRERILAWLAGRGAGA
jgi:hypothetical protein